MTFVRLSMQTKTKAISVPDGTDNGPRNIEGILMALRYLSLEAEGAGLTELANHLGGRGR